MTTGTLHPLAAEYLDRLRHAGRRLPRTERRDLLAEIEAHLKKLRRIARRAQPSP